MEDEGFDVKATDQSNGPWSVSVYDNGDEIVLSVGMSITDHKAYLTPRQALDIAEALRKRAGV